MPEFFNIFFQRKTVERIVSEKPSLSKSLIIYIVSLAVVLVGTTIGTFLEQLILLLLGWQDIFAVLFSTALNFVFYVLIAIPGLIGFALLVLVYFLFARLLGGRAVDFKQFLSDFLLVAASVGIVIGIISAIPFLHHLINFFVVLYGFFLYIKLMSEYFSISFLKAFVVWFVPTAILAVVTVLPLITIAGIAFFL